VTPPPANPVHDRPETPKVDVDAVLDIVATPDVKEKKSKDDSEAYSSDKAYDEVLDRNSEDGRCITP
jgi:hypothetical protein